MEYLLNQRKQSWYRQIWEQERIDCGYNDHEKNSIWDADLKLGTSVLIGESKNKGSFAPETSLKFDRIRKMSTKMLTLISTQDCF